MPCASSRRVEPEAVRARFSGRQAHCPGFHQSISYALVGSRNRDGNLRPSRLYRIYLGYTGHSADAVAKAARDPKLRFVGPRSPRQTRVVKSISTTTLEGCKQIIINGRGAGRQTARPQSPTACGSLRRIHDPCIRHNDVRGRIPIAVLVKTGVKAVPIRNV